ncbi:DUF602-domain-containing protein [Lophiostoma macrostomum CBS 122681]|uniref:DUF602-domain-containing protein n=1 Tax=Lophiostoma macrostomum CBS 122681 TaxID=1314788 RepID=A0A6A6TPY9_9PLEO|nr:DUF602-domain-containing protein [Lophiostoma macrostomum CBS 122681]
MNMDALWGVAAKIPDSGPGAASQVTYTTILNAIRQSLLVNIPVGETDEQIAERRDRGVIEGRRVWEEIIGKWRNADLIIGEELVCSMGRLLLVGARPQDWDDVLSLVEQTMDVKRQVPRLGSPDRIKAGFPRLRGPHIPEQYRTEDGHLRPSQGSERGEEFLPVRTGKPQDNVFSSPLTYATPSNNTLSMVQEACQKIVAVKAADEYWDLLTDPRSYSVNPDLDNIHFRLRVLRQYRASAETVKLLKDSFATKKLQARPGTFRIAISACARDSNNHNSIKHAGQIVDIMMKTLEDADPKVVAKYAGLMKGSPTAKGPDIMDALARLHPVVRNLRVQLSVGMEDRGHLKGVVQLNAAQENDAVDALRQIYGLVDKLLLSHLISDELKKPFKKSRATLASFLHRFAYKSGNWRGKPDGDNGGLDAKEDQNAETDPLQELSQDTVEKSGRKPRWHHTALQVHHKHRPTETMGNDGGSIPKRRELVKEAAKALTVAQIKEVRNEQQEHAWSHDPLTRRPLSRPVVSDSAGILYNKDSVIEHLLKEEGDAQKVEWEKTLQSRVKGLKDVVEVKFEVDEEKKEESARGEKWVCPITGKELGPGAKAVYLVPCGHAFAGSVVKEVQGSACLQCNESYAENDVVAILPTEDRDIARLTLRMKTLKEKGLTHALKKEKGGKKKRKHADKEANGDSEKSKQTIPAPSNGIKNASTASLTKKVLEEQEARNKRRKMEQNDNVKSLFSRDDRGVSMGNSADYMTRGFSIPTKK